MVSDIPPVGITQNERFLSCNSVPLGVRYAVLCVGQDSFKILQ
jgi:hypothetical protein